MMLPALLLLAGQTGASPPPERFSVLAQPCPVGEQAAAKAGQQGDVVVCADPNNGPRLPLPDERGPPNHGVPINPKMDGVGALAAEGTPCAASQKGCTVGFGPPIVPMVAAVAGLVKDAFAKKPDKTGRVAIDLDAPPPVTTGHVHP
jgi:hypothetical protein